MKRKVILVMTAIALIAVFGLYGCASKETVPAESIEEIVEPAALNAVWVAYWGQDLAEEQLQQADFQTVCLFGASFDAEGKPFVHEKTQELAAQLQENGQQRLYLTFVNDIIQESGNSLKDTELLYQLLGTEKAIKSHIQEILDMTENGGYDGIEIDYERIRKDMTLWAHFQTFLEQLMPEAERRGFPSGFCWNPERRLSPFLCQLDLEYVVMCYNLHGGGTPPGPKADREFLLSLKERFSQLPGVGFALANGGYVWDGHGKATALTTSAAIQLAEEKAVSPKRSEKNGGLTFSYRENGEKYTVWYGDDQTIQCWSEILNQDNQNCPMSLWRLNG